MACVTLKRPLEWIDPSMSPESGSSSPTHMIISNSPPHHGLRSPKRLCLQSLSQSPSTSAITSSSYSNTFNTFMPHQTCHFSSSSTSPFANNFSTANANQQPNSGNNYNFKRIISSDLADQIREEVLRLRLVRRKIAKVSAIGNKLQESSLSGSSLQQQDTKAIRNNVATDKQHQQHSSSSSANTSTSSTHHAAYSLYASLIDAANHHNEQEQHDVQIAKYKDGNLSSTTHNSDNNPDDDDDGNENRKKSSSASKSLASINNNEPLFTFNHVVLIVERILREKEESIRREYDAILSQRLADQYDQFVKFSYDQIQRRFDSQSLPSYLS
ncbi:uncharacterized protein LOC124498960 [Dermatophagoides farinae]|uniref:Akirin-2 n=1 Tax=Dermatophagoides farinae TaxID=6954 RepID=A0A922HZM7_DERFA|nr:protein roadkill-like [Dermatophagoides farinae]KAH7645970.1 hypothetical protein HUG17_1508 [Dermatophagoides farinae]KAH9516255.1 Akirin-2 [Dermatophagoides farinae]